MIGATLQAVFDMCRELQQVAKKESARVTQDSGSSSSSNSESDTDSSSGSDTDSSAWLSKRQGFWVP